MDFKALNSFQIEILRKTISHTSTFWLIQDAMFKNEGCSVIRFADGEYRIIEDAKNYSGKFCAFGDEWNQIYGLENLDIQILKNQLIDSGNNCRYLAPSISGIWWDIYDGWHYFKPRQFYVDNFFPYGMLYEQIQHLLDNAKGIAYIQRDAHFSSDAKINRPNKNIKHIPLNSYKDIPDVINSIANSGCQLILWAGGPIGKVLGPHIEKLGKIGLDIGSAIERWV